MGFYLLENNGNRKGITDLLHMNRVNMDLLNKGNHSHIQVWLFTGVTFPRFQMFLSYCAVCCFYNLNVFCLPIWLHQCCVSYISRMHETIVLFLHRIWTQDRNHLHRSYLSLITRLPPLYFLTHFLPYIAIANYV